MTGKIVSLRESMDRLDQEDTRVQAALRALAGTLTAIERHIFALHRDKLRSEPPSLEFERRQVLRQADRDVFEVVGRKVERDLRETASQIRSKLAGVVELSEVVMLLAGAAQTIESGSHTRQVRLQVVHSELEAGLNLQTVEGFREHIRTQITNLTRVVEEMHAENQTLLEDLQREMQSYRRQLDQASCLANRDPLTGLGNRRTLEVRLRELIEARIGFCLVLIDFNRFKFINDQYGHLAGDELLCSFATRLLAQVREDDTAVRWGGDEFVILLPVSLPDAMARARLLERQLSGDYRVTSDDRSVRVPLTVTMAVAEHRTGESVEQMLARTDTMLYASKSTRV